MEDNDERAYEARELANHALEGMLGKNLSGKEMEMAAEQDTMERLRQKGYAVHDIREDISLRLSKKYQNYIYPNEVHLIGFDKETRAISFRYSNTIGQARLIDDKFKAR